MKIAWLLPETYRRPIFHKISNCRKSSVRRLALPRRNKNSSCVIIHDPVGGLIRIIQDASSVQKSNHLRFSAAVRANRSISACCPCQFFDRLRASGAPIANDGISGRVLCQNVKHNCGSGVRGLGNASNKGMWYLLEYTLNSKLNTEIGRLVSLSCVFDILSAHAKLSVQ
jgi:hypothetical protein